MYKLLINYWLALSDWFLHILVFCLKNENFVNKSLDTNFLRWSRDTKSRDKKSRDMTSPDHFSKKWPYCLRASSYMPDICIVVLQLL